MDAIDARNRIRTRLQQWRARLEQLKAERKEQTGGVRSEYLRQLRELQAAITEEVQQWDVDIDIYDTDPNVTTQKEFEERFGLPEIQREISAELAASKTESHDVG